MALQFSHVRVSTPDGNEAEFLVCGIPREFDDFEYSTAFEDFLDGIEEDTEITVHADAYLYGEGETFKASIEEACCVALVFLGKKLKQIIFRPQANRPRAIKE